MKKIILLLLLFSNLMFGYQVTNLGLYTFDSNELEILFGPNAACQVSGTIVFNEGRIKYALKGSSTYEDALKVTGNAAEKFNRYFVINEEGWSKYKDPYKNLANFYITNCPKALERTIKQMLPKEDYRIMKKLHMTKIFKGKKTDKMDRYGNYYRLECKSYVDHTYETANSKVNVMKDKCWYEKIEDI